MTQSSFLLSDALHDAYAGISMGIRLPTWIVKNAIKTGWKAITPSGEIEVERQSINNNEKKMKKQVDSLKVIGVGYSRTGTWSLAKALNELDFPTFHTMDFFQDEEIFENFVNGIFYESIKEDKIIMGVPDFDLLLRAGYTATMDLPFAFYYDQILEKYPDCKFILTLRDDSNVWWRSWNSLTESEGATLVSKSAGYIGAIIPHLKKSGYYKRWLYSVINQDKTFLNHPFPLPAQNRERSISGYEKHNQGVRDSIPPSQLLEYSVKEGWEPLCTFLEIPEAECPSSHGIPFPKTNSTNEVRWHAYSATIAPIFFAMFILNLVRKIMKKEGHKKMD